jgi:uncharacterized membrane protein
MIESIAIFTVAFTIIKTITKFIQIFSWNKSEVFYHEIKLDFGISLALALNFLLAADIVATAVSSTWEAVGLLAAIAGIRTFLNYFLRQEVKGLASEEQRNKVERIFKH